MSALIPIFASVVGALVLIWIGRRYAAHLRRKAEAHRASGKPGTPWYVVGGEEDEIGSWSRDDRRKD